MGVAIAYSQLGRPCDFATLWTSAQHLSSPYDRQWIAAYERDHSVVLPFAYPPVLLLIVAPFGQLPLVFALLLWSGLSMALFAHVATYVARIGAPLLFLSPPVLFCASLGQTTLLVASLMAAGMMMLERRPRIAGALLALAICIKPQSMLAAPIVLWGRWGVVRWAILCATAYVALSCLLGPMRWVEWFEVVRAFPQWFANVRMVAPGALLPGAPWRLLVAALGVAFALRRDFLGLVVGALCMTPYAQLYDLPGLALIGVTWVARWKQVGLAPALLGAFVTFSLGQSPLSILIVVLLIGMLHLAWTPFTRREALAVP